MKTRINHFFPIFSSIRIILLITFILFFSDQLRSQWINCISGSNVYSLASNGSNIFSGVYGVMRSTNGGMNWSQVNSGLGNTSVMALTISGTTLFAGTLSGQSHCGVFRSTNNGENWTSLYTAFFNHYVTAMASNANTIFAGITGGSFTGLIRSTDNGDNWVVSNSGLTSTHVYTLAYNGSNIFAGIGGISGGIFRSTNNGANWINVNNGLSPDIDVFSFAFIGSRMYAGSLNGIFLSTNNGNSWNSVSALYTFSLAVSGTTIFAGSGGSGIYRSTNYGENWTSINSGSTGSYNINCLFAHGSNLYAGTHLHGVWRRALSEIISIENISTEVPEEFKLKQNYPNPFNPFTNIEFSIPKLSNIKIAVYNMQGKEVAALLNERLSAGSYRVDFDETNLSSGIYFYRMETEEFIQTKTMVLIK